MLGVNLASAEPKREGLKDRNRYLGRYLGTLPPRYLGRYQNAKA